MNLEPCPFCGGEALALVYCVGCKSCRATTKFYHSIEPAIEAWNRRPALAAAVQAEREACARLADQMSCNDTGTFGDGFSAACNEIECKILARGPAPAVDVLAVVRDFFDAEDGIHGWTSKEDQLARKRRRYAAHAALRALVAPRTAEESSGVNDVAKRLMGFRLVHDASIPPGEIHANVDGYTAGKIVGMDAPANPEARED